jgi:hypothetical protein
MPIESRLKGDGIFLVNLTVEALEQLAEPTAFMSHYAHDVAKTVLPVIRGEENRFTVPLLMQWGDHESSTVPPLTGGNGRTYFSPSIPHLKKYRAAALLTAGTSTIGDSDNGKGPTPAEQLYEQLASAQCYNGPDRPRLPTIYGQNRLQPIIWNLNTPRHFGPVQEAVLDSVAWEDKKDQAVFRGAMTAHFKAEMYQKNVSADRLCELVPRCKLVVSYEKSPLVDALLTLLPSVEVNRPLDTTAFRKAALTDDEMNIASQLQYKALILLEGNDVASGLKWALASNSIVLMPPPTASTWAMEELLQPWVHYVPLDPNLTNVEEQMQWVLNHDTEAQQIANRGSLWIKDLVLHPQAADDDKDIYKKILCRYQQHFAQSDSLIEEEA